MHTHSALFFSPLGNIAALASDTHLVFLAFKDSDAYRTLGENLFSSNSTSDISSSVETGNLSPILKQTERELAEYFHRKRKRFSLPIALTGTEFQKRIWTSLMAVPYGETKSYGTLAQMIGHQNAARAIGNALNKNPIQIIIPCHRIIGADGSITGYNAGIERKQWLLQHERSYHGGFS